MGTPVSLPQVALSPGSAVSGDGVAYRFLGLLFVAAGLVVWLAKSAFVLLLLSDRTSFWSYPFWPSDPAAALQRLERYDRLPGPALWLSLGLIAVLPAVLVLFGSACWWSAPASRAERAARRRRLVTALRALSRCFLYAGLALAAWFGYRQLQMLLGSHALEVQAESFRWTAEQSQRFALRETLLTAGEIALPFCAAGVAMLVLSRLVARQTLLPPARSDAAVRPTGVALVLGGVMAWLLLASSALNLFGTLDAWGAISWPRGTEAVFEDLAGNHPVRLSFRGSVLFTFMGACLPFLLVGAAGCWSRGTFRPVFRGPRTAAFARRAGASLLVAGIGVGVWLTLREYQALASPRAAELLRDRLSWTAEQARTYAVQRGLQAWTSVVLPFYLVGMAAILVGRTGRTRPSFEPKER